MRRWVTTPKPSAELQQESEEPEKRDDGALITYFRTKYGVRFAQICEPTGFILWLKEIT